MASQSTSFAIGSKYGPRSAMWIVTVKGEDVVVTTAKCRRVWHVSLHKSGRWHVKMHGRFATPSMAPLMRSHSNDVPIGAYKVGLYIGIPDSCLRPASDVDRTLEPEHWFERPTHGGVVEVAVMKWDVREPNEEWPGQSAGVQLRIAYLVSEFVAVGVLTRHLEAEHPIAQKMNAMVDDHTKQFVPVVLDSPERRGYIGGRNAVGSLVITEYAID